MPKTAAIVPGWQWFMDELVKRTNGMVKIEPYGGAVLFDQKATPDSLKSGIADMSNVSTSAHSQLFPVSNLFVLPGLEFPDSTADGFMKKYDAYMQLREKYPAIKNELKDYKLLFWCPNPAYRLISKKLIAVPEDIKGLKLGGNASQSKVTQAGGGVWVQAVPNDVYEGMNKGVFDGAYVSWAQVNVYHFEEVATFFLDYGFTQEAQQVCMNLNTWNSLSPDVQKIFTDLTAETVRRASQAQIDSNQKGIDGTKAKNRTITVPNVEQRAKWDATIGPIADEWAKDLVSKGVTSAPDILKDIIAARAAAYK